MKLKRPEDDEVTAPWMVYDETGLADFIDPTPELKSWMETESGYFDAEPTEAGWDIRARVADPKW
ncbi:MAG: hypothetical protein ABIO39_06300 [Caulobacteraceae bacterium]